MYRLATIFNEIFHLVYVSGKTMPTAFANLCNDKISAYPALIVHIYRHREFPDVVNYSTTMLTNNVVNNSCWNSDGLRF